MNQPRLICLSLAPNLRCVGFTVEQFVSLIIPPAIEVLISTLFIYLYAGPGRWSQIILSVDSLLYFTWALLDMLPHVIRAARNSYAVFNVLSCLVGTVSFSPIFFYAIYLYRLSLRDFIPNLPHNLRPYPEFSLPVLLVMSVAINEVSSFVGAYPGKSSDGPPVVVFSNNSDTLWLSLTQVSLTMYTLLQFFFFLLASSRLSRAFLDQRRAQTSHSNERPYVRGIVWITASIGTGVVEAITGFVQVGFSVTLARRILRLISRAMLMFGLSKGLGRAEGFKNLVDEPRSFRISKRIPHMVGVDAQQASMSRRISRSTTKQTPAVECSATEKQHRTQHVTVHCEKGQAPFLQIRFSTLDFPAEAIFADTIQQRRRSQPGLVPGCAQAGNHAQQHTEDRFDERIVTQNTTLDTPSARPELISGSDYAAPDWAPPPARSLMSTGSGATVSDNLSIVRDLERKFPNLPPRVTGKYRGSILGQNYEEDPFPVVGISRQSSLRQGSSNEEGGTSVALSPSSSIKRKPAPPLLDDIAHISNRRSRPMSTWGGLTGNTVDYSVDFPATVHGPDPTLEGETSTRRPRRITARDLIERAGKAVSDASIRSAEWLAQASSAKPTGTMLTVADIEMYRRGGVNPTHAQRG